MKKRKGYDKGLAREMYLYFNGCCEGYPPSFSKFARRKGITLGELRSYRKHKNFDKAYIECLEIRRDYLIDQALSKKFDSSLVKYLLDEEAESSDAEIKFKLEVV